MGRHLIVEMMGSPVEALNNISFVDTVFREACSVGSLTLLKMQLHKFEPQGSLGSLFWPSRTFRSTLGLKSHTLPLIFLYAEKMPIQTLR